MDYLKDDKLEKLGFIKEIDTLKIIESSQQRKEKKNKTILFLLFAVMIITSFIGQMLFVYLFGGIKLIKVGISLYIFISIVVTLILVDKGEEGLC